MASIPSPMKCFFCGGNRDGIASIDDYRLMGYSACESCITRCTHGTSDSFVKKVFDGLDVYGGYEKTNT